MPSISAVAEAKGGITRSSFLIAVFFLFVLSPKIDIISYSFSGIRAEDFLFLIAIPVALLGKNWQRVTLPKYLIVYLLYCAFCLLSALLNIRSNGLDGILFTMRQMQYLFWFFVAAELAPCIDIKTFKFWINVAAIVLIVWGGGEMLGVIPKIGKFSNAVSRLTLNTSGPYETSVLLVFLMLFCRNILINSCLFVLMVATQARITLLSFVIIFVTKNKRRVMLLGIVCVIAGLLNVFGVFSYLYSLTDNSRLAATASAPQMFAALQYTWAQAYPMSSTQQFMDTFYQTSNPLYKSMEFSDMSFFIRAVRWVFIIKSWYSDFFHLLFGWGPGAWRIVDGNYVRIVGEAGLFGMVTFLWFVWKAATDRHSWPQIGQAVIVIVICSVFIDIAVSSKVMTMFWFFCGLSAADHGGGTMLGRALLGIDPEKPEQAR